MTAPAKGRTLYQAANKTWIGADPVPWEELGTDDQAQLASIEDAVQVPLRERIAELEQLLAAVLGSYRKTSDGMRARTTQVIFAQWCDTARCPLPEGVHR